MKEFENEFIMTEDQQKEHADMIAGFINDIVIFADKHNLNRDDAFLSFSSMINMCCEMTSLSEYKLKEQKNERS